MEQNLPADPGKERAFLEVYKRIHGEAMDHARMFLDEGAAWDAVQEAYTSIWKRWDYLRPEQRSNAYFFASVHNAVLKILRADKRYVELGDAEQQLTELAFESINASQIAERQADLAMLMDRFIGEMPPRRREVFVLARERGMSHAEIAESLGISAASVNKHMSLANAALAAELARNRFLGQPPIPKALPPESGEASNE